MIRFINRIEICFMTRMYYRYYVIYLLSSWLWLQGEDLQEYGIYWDGPPGQPEINEGVDVPGISDFLTDDDYETLTTSFAPLGDSTMQNYCL